jgi:ribosomal peptide maturation radical SAM protein 1
MGDPKHGRATGETPADQGSLPIRRSGDILFISPPFSAINRPSLGLHLLDKIAADEEVVSDIYYANLHLAKFVGEAAYIAVAESATFVGERVFSPFAFPNEAFSSELYTACTESSPFQPRRDGTDMSAIAGRFAQFEAMTGAWLLEFRKLIAWLEFGVFGLSTMFAQNLACVCLARIIKEERPNSLVLIGGANCDDTLAKGIASLTPAFDYIFVGEAEATFRAFCRNLKQGKLPESRFITGTPTIDLDQSPFPDYGTFFAQMSFFLPGSTMFERRQISLPYETSRGCWWGQKHHCTFCGLNGSGMAFRMKSASKVVDELRALRARYGKYLIAMSDNIMPSPYYRDVLPRIVEEDLDLEVFYEVKANINQEQVILLKDSGVNLIQPGIEALSSSLLRRLRKGVTAAQNICLLRDCRSLEVFVIWNILFDVPGDEDREYEETLSLIPKLRHLEPPNRFTPVNLDRFSPYFNEPERFRIANLRPNAWYYDIYPSHIAVDDLAYHFVGDADVVGRRNPALVRDIASEVQAWIDRWQGPRKPVLSVSHVGSGEYIVYDSRGAGDPQASHVSRSMASIVTGQTRDASAEVDEAMDREWVIKIDGIHLGLAVASREILGRVQGAGMGVRNAACHGGEPAGASGCAAF